MMISSSISPARGDARRSESVVLERNLQSNHHRRNEDSEGGALSPVVPLRPPQSSSFAVSFAAAEELQPPHRGCGGGIPHMSQLSGPALIEATEGEVVMRPMRPPPSVSSSSSAANVVRPLLGLVRPVPLKVVRPVAVPAEAALAFYSEGHLAGVSGEDLHRAALVSHEWHRKWTHQDETGHGFRESAAFDHLPPTLLYDRSLGAKNPSPEDKEESHHGPFDWEERDEHRPPKRGRSAFLEGSDADAATKRWQPVHQQQPSLVGLVRPVALRIARPSAIRPLAPFPRAAAASSAVPQDMLGEILIQYSAPSSQEDEGNHSSAAHHLHHQHHHRLSPLTVSSSSSNGGSTKSSPSPTRVHLISPDDDSLKSLPRPSPVNSVALAVQSARDGLLQALVGHGGTTSVATNPAFHACLDVLQQHHRAQHRLSQASEEGTWLSLTAPNYFGQIGTSDNGDPLYTLGRMAFDMFSPTSLVCSLQGTFNSVERVSESDRARVLRLVPQALRDEVEANTSVLRTYNIMAAFTIEPPSEEFPDAPNRDVKDPIRGIMTTYGYTLPDPNEPHRLSIWITGGRIEPNGSPADHERWRRQFNLHPAQHSLGEKAKLLAVKLLMGAHLHPMAEDGSVEYTFTRPLGGHGIAYVDTLYCDKSLRVVRGHRGTVFVFSRMPEHHQQHPKNLQHLHPGVKTALSSSSSSRH